jgi:hypothetical protein
VDEPGTRPAPASAYEIGDVHGHRAELVAALRASGLVDADERWCGGTTQVWFLGDFFDRGPHGVGVVELVMSLSEQAPDDGGSVRALLGNHEVLALGMHRFGDLEVPSEYGPRSFERSWRLNGGQAADQRALTDRHVDWLSGLPVIGHADDDHLLMHSDTVEYFAWGETVDDINERVRSILADDDLEQWWDCWRRMTTRYAFRGPGGAEVAGQVLAAFGGSRIVHGHSVIADQLGIQPSEVIGPCLYARGRALGIDGGVFVGGPCLIVPLPLPDLADLFGTEDHGGAESAPIAAVEEVGLPEPSESDAADAVAETVPGIAPERADDDIDEDADDYFDDDFAEDLDDDFAEDDAEDIDEATDELADEDIADDDIGDTVGAADPVAEDEPVAEEQAVVSPREAEPDDERVSANGAPAQPAGVERD